MMKMFLIVCTLLQVVIVSSHAGEDLRLQLDPTSDHNKAHLKDDLSGVIDKKPEDMTIRELQFHFFREHDRDGDERLDGSEIVASILHHEGRHTGQEPRKKFPDDELIGIVDDILKFQDANRDGALDFKEYTTPYHPPPEATNRE